MAKLSKRFKEIEKLIDKSKVYSLDDAIQLLQECPPVKFDQSIEISLKMGVDPKKSDQQVRSTVLLPHGTGKNIRVLVLAKGDKVKTALDAGAEFAGDADLLEKIKGGWTDYDAVIATPDMMREVGKLGKILGPRGLMPTPKAGTVTQDVAKAVADLKKGKIEFKVDKSGVINNFVGKLSFSKLSIVENINALIASIMRMKPATAKGQYLRSVALSSTMGPGFKIDINTLTT
ncbi:MAG: 50S ribosomal protein L1 [Simkaniaceae bacterium]|nr:50S ribosomal protein L1 [Simkaniaceae bacterium]